MESIAGKSLPSLGQVGIVVKNVDKTIAYYTEYFGLGPFQIIDFNPEKHWVRGQPHPIQLKIALAEMGPVHLELMEPVGGDSPHKQFLDEKGEGLQHLGFYIDDYDGWMAHLKAKGIEVLKTAETTVEGMGRIRAAYLESDQPGGVLFELIEIKPPA